MNTEENQWTRAAKKLELLVEGALHMRDEKVMIPVQDAADLLEYIDELEGMVLNREKIAIGDTVSIIKDDSGIHNWMVGFTGVVVEIDEGNDKLPVVVEFPSNLRARAHYTELRKV